MSKKASAVAAPKGAVTLNDRKKRFNAIEPYIWIAPSIILMAIFIVTPIFSVFKMALSSVNKAGLVVGFAGLDNFSKVLSSEKNLTSGLTAGGAKG